MIDHCTALILAGGNSRRMGKDKAITILADDTLLNRAICQVQPHFSKLIVSVRQHREQLLLPQICDQKDPCNQNNAQGPIIGVSTALQHVATPWLFVIACDMPFVSEKLMHAMARQRNGQEAIVATTAGRLQPLLALYAKSCLPRMRQHITSGNRSLQALLQQANTTIIREAECRQYDPDLLSFMDMDTPEDITRAAKILRNKDSR